MNAATPAPTLLRTDFEAWLAGKGNAYVGTRADCRACPVALWLIERSWDRAQVGPLYVRYDWAREVKTPDWVHAFISEVDTGGKVGACVRATTALRILRSLPQ